MLVLGLHGGVAALAAARRGAKVVWVERVRRFADVARNLVARNGLDASIDVVTAANGAPYAALALKSKRGAKGFDVVCTERFEHQKIDGGLTAVADACHRQGWLRKGGSFLPAAVEYAVAAADARSPDDDARGAGAVAFKMERLSRRTRSWNDLVGISARRVRAGSAART